VKSGKWYQGKHEPVISETEYNEVQLKLGQNGNPRPIRALDFAFTGLIRCGECQARVTAEEKHQIICSHCRRKFAYRRRDACPQCDTPIEKMDQPTVLHYTYYHCTKRVNPDCSQKSVSGKDLDQQIEAFLKRIHISDNFKKWAIKHLHGLHTQETRSRTDDIKSQRKLYDACLRRIDNLAARF